MLVAAPVMASTKKPLVSDYETAMAAKGLLEFAEFAKSLEGIREHYPWYVLIGYAMPACYTPLHAAFIHIGHGSRIHRGTVLACTFCRVPRNPTSRLVAHGLPRVLRPELELESSRLYRETTSRDLISSRVGQAEVTNNPLRDASPEPV